MDTLGLRRLVTISRPRTWMYLLGSFLIGWMIHIPAGDLRDVLTLTWPVLLLFIFHFTFTCNLLLHGMSDLFDQRSTLLEEERHPLVYSMIVAHAPIIAFIWMWFPTASSEKGFTSILALCILSLIFMVLAVGYSAPPIRAKSRPILHGAFHALYFIPGLVGFLLTSFES